MAFSHAVSIEDLRRLARRRLPRVVFGYLDGGAEAELQPRPNSAACARAHLRRAHGVPVRQGDLRARVLNTELPFPALLAPVGYSRLMHPGGEDAAPPSAGEAGPAHTRSAIPVATPRDAQAPSTWSVWAQ